MMSTQMSWSRWVENVADLADALRTLYPDVRFDVTQRDNYVRLIGYGIFKPFEIPLATTAIGTLAIDELRKRLGLEQLGVPVPLSAHPVTRSLLAALEEQRSSLGTVQKALTAFEDLLKLQSDKPNGDR